MPHPKCQDCICFNEIKGPREIGEKIIGECRRQPPVIIQDLESGQSGFTWPLVDEGDWCIEGFTPKEKDQDHNQERSWKVDDLPRT